MQRDHHDHISEALAEIDAELARPPISIEDAINEAIRCGRMTLEEGMDCLQCYEKSFNLGRVAFKDGSEDL